VGESIKWKWVAEKKIRIIREKWAVFNDTNLASAFCCDELHKK